MATVHGVIHGKTIELNEAIALPDGQKVVVQVQPELEPPPKWTERFTVDPSVALGKLIVKGTRLLAEDLAALIDQGRSDDELRALHPELNAEDLAALREYVKTSPTLRSLFGAWAEDAEELDKFLEERRQHRKLKRRGIEEE